MPNPGHVMNPDIKYWEGGQIVDKPVEQSLASQGSCKASPASQLRLESEALSHRSPLSHAELHLCTLLRIVQTRPAHLGLGTASMHRIESLAKIVQSTSWIPCFSGRAVLCLLEALILKHAEQTLQPSRMQRLLQKQFQCRKAIEATNDGF